MNENEEYPYFENPPLKEVSFLVQFDPIPGFHIGMVGLLWEKFRKEFPLFEEAAPLVTEIEKFGLLPPRRDIQFQVLGKPDTPRAFFISTCKQWLIQVQADRFGLNWRQLDSAFPAYPRYRSTSARFFSELDKFKSFLKEQDLFLTPILQLELTYVNSIQANGMDPHYYFHDMLQPSRVPNDMKQEAVGLNLMHTVESNGAKVGRLHTVIKKQYSMPSGQESYALTFNEKVFPKSQDPDSISEGFSLMRGHINFCFCSMTREEAHKEWQKKEQ